MGLARWSRVGPPAVLVLAALVLTAVTPTALSAALNPPPRTDCASLSPLAAARAALGVSNATPALDVRPELGKRGELTGRALTAQSGSGAVVSISLPTESF